MILGQMMNSCRNILTLIAVSFLCIFARAQESADSLGTACVPVMTVDEAVRKWILSCTISGDSSIPM